MMTKASESPAAEAKRKRRPLDDSLILRLSAEVKIARLDADRFEVRSPSGDAVIDGNMAELLRRFRQAAPLAETIAQYCEDTRQAADVVRGWAHPWIRAFVREGILRRPNPRFCLEPGERVPAGQIRARVHGGKRSEIYLLRQASGQLAALKLYRGAEAPSGVRAGGPTLLATGRWQDRWYEVLEWHPGVSLRAAAESARGSGPEGNRELQGLVDRLRDAIAALHQRGLVHGSLSPDSIEIDGTGAVTFYDALPQPAPAALPRARHADRTQLEQLTAQLCPGEEPALDASPGARAPLVERPTALAIDQLLQHARPGSDFHARGFAPPTSNVVMGAAGLSYALLGIHQIRGDEESLALAADWSARAMAALGRPEACWDGVYTSLEATGPVSLFCGEPGVLTVDALVNAAAGNSARARASVQRFVTLVNEDGAQYDLTFGHAGIVFGALTLLPLGHELAGLRRVVTTKVGRLVALMRQEPGIAGSRLVPLMGMAHGWAGLLHAVLRAHQAVGIPLPDFIPERLEELATSLEPWQRGRRPRRTTVADEADYMTGWCNGSAGLVHLWCRADQLFGGNRFLDLAEQCALATLDERGGGGDICCGAAGGAIALMDFHRSSGLGLWARRGEVLLDRARAAHRHIVVCRNSLFKGEAGVALALAQGSEARIPLYS